MTLLSVLCGPIVRCNRVHVKVRKAHVSSAIMKEFGVGVQCLYF